MKYVTSSRLDDAKPVDSDDAKQVSVWRYSVIIIIMWVGEWGMLGGGGGGQILPTGRESG